MNKKTLIIGGVVVVGVLIFKPGWAAAALPLVFLAGAVGFALLRAWVPLVLLAVAAAIPFAIGFSAAKEFPLPAFATNQPPTDWYFTAVFGTGVVAFVGIVAAAATYTDLTVQTSLQPFNSDHVSFIDAGLPAVLAIEGADGANEHIHTAGDTIDRLDADLVLAILRMNTAFVADAIGQS